MATAAVARPSNAISAGSNTMRTRRDAPRLSIKRGLDTNGDGGPARKKRFVEPYVRTRQHYLKKFARKPVSMVVHLHQSHFKIEGQEGSFPNDSPMRVFLEHLRRETVPHEMMDVLLGSHTPFYDGCLIVEVHNHRNPNGKNRARRQDTAGDNATNSMHKYTNYITPSPLAPYPKKAAEQHDSAEPEDADTSNNDRQRNTEQGGPKIATLVLQPTDLSRHAEMLILASTPASAMKVNRRSADTPTNAQPPTPHLSVPATPLIAAGRGSPGQEGKMCLEAEDLYQFQAEVLLSTEPPLLLETGYTGHEALDALAHPLHSALPPSPKTRKRTTAELAADDAQAAEAERRMLIMDERIKPSARSGAGVNSGDNGAAAASLGFTRFKTIAMVREKQEEIERHKKEEEAQAAVQRRQQEEASQASQRAEAARNEQQRKIMTQRALHAREQARNHQQQAQAQILAQQQNHGHPGSNGMMINPNFQQTQMMAQASPAPRNHTPMQSSPMVQHNGVPLARTSSQQAGSPPRPTSAVPNANLMAQQLSQQQHGSRIATPNVQHGTPNMGNVLPGRQMSQTPRMPHGSPAPGTPAAAPNMQMQTPGQTGMTPEQMAMFQQAQRQMAMQGQAGSPAQVANMTPEQIQNIRQQHHQRAQAMQMQAAQQQHPHDPRFAAAVAQRQAMMLQQSQNQALRQRMLAQQNGMGQGQQHPNMGQGGSPQVGRPNMSAHGHPQAQHGGDMNGNAGQHQQQQQPQLTHEQQLARNQAIRVAQAQVAQLGQQYNGIHNIPQNIAQSLPPISQMMLRQQQHRQQAQRTQAMAIKAQQAQNGGQQVAGNSAANPEYMASLRENQQLLAMHQSQGGIGMGGQFGRGQQGGNDHLSQQMLAMQQTLQRNQNMQ